MSNNWLQELKEGDRVYFGNEYLEVGTVERITQTLIVVNGKKFRKSDGSLQGKWYYSRPWLREATPERDAKYQKHCLLQDLEQIKFSSLSINQLERILAIAKEGSND